MSKISLKHSGGNVVSLNSPTNAPSAADVAFKLPNADGTSGQFIKTDGSGNLAFAAAGGGKILQVVSTTKTDQFSSSTAQTFTDITGLSVDITPSATTSKILVTASICFGLDVSHSIVVYRFMRDSTPIAIANADNNRPRGTFMSMPTNDSVMANAVGMHLDSPSSTSQLTYKIQFYDYHNNTFYVNRSFRNFNASTYDMVATSSITVQEVAA